MISFIVSSFNRPLQLRGCLASLAIQQVSKEIIVCDNSSSSMTTWLECRCPQYIYYYTGYKHPHTCYHDPRHYSARGNWFCFPSDDSYYVPRFAEIMVATAERNGWDFVYCDTLYDPRLAFDTQGIPDTYSVMKVAPSDGRIDKTCFLIKRSAFEKIGGWPPHEHDHRDGALAAKVVEMGIPYGKAPGVMVVHN